MSVEPDRIVRTRRRTMVLIVESDGSLTVRAPLRTSDQSILEFAERSRRWIEKKQAEALATRPAPRQYVPGETFLYLGQAYPLEIVKDQNPPLVLAGSFKLSEAARSQAEQLFRAWYRRQARRIIRSRVNWYAKTQGFQVAGIRITSARTRWGSCSAKGALSFSWRLILAPMEVVDYVVVHELVHTIHHNHSKRFWKKVEKILPDYKACNRWLSRNGHQTLA